MKQLNYISRVLCALLLCAGLVFAGCTEGPLGDDQKTEQGDNQNNSNENGGDNTGGSQDKPTDENEVTSGPATITIDKITATTVTFKGKIDVAEADRDFSSVGLSCEPPVLSPPFSLLLFSLSPCSVFWSSPRGPSVQPATTSPAQSSSAHSTLLNLLIDFFI